MEGSLLERDAEEFIENDVSKRYRISKYQGFVTCDRDKLLRHTDPAARELAKKLLKIGGDARK